MKHIEISSPGGPEVLRFVESAIPKPHAEEVLIKVFAAGINRPDILQRKGLYPPPPGSSPIPGLEVAGVVEALGSDTKKFKIGDKVCALVSGGGYAEYCVAPLGQCLPIPDGCNFIEAAGIPETFFTVWSNIFMRGGLKSGESLLIHGGSSGIGTTAIQLAIAKGAKPFVTAGSDEKCQACINLGAIAAVNYKTRDFVAILKSASSSRGFDMILDMVGGDYFDKNVELLAREGRLVQIGTQQGEKVSLSLRALMAKGLSISGSTLRPRTVAQKSVIAQALLENVWPLFENKKVRVVLDSVFDLKDAALAHQKLERSEHVGKIILNVSS